MFRERDAGGCIIRVASVALLVALLAAELTGRLPIFQRLNDLYPPRAHVEESTIANFVSWVLQPRRDDYLRLPILQPTPINKP